VSFGFVPGYQLFHLFRRDMFWGAGLGAPLIFADWQKSTPTKMAFSPGLEVHGQFGYRFLGGLAAYVRVVYDLFFGTYTLTTFGGEIGLAMYYEWFDAFEEADPMAGSEAQW
jgi:hypothetical protein